MCMNYIRVVDKYVFRELTYEFWIAYGLYKGNAKFIELNSFHCGQ